MTAHTCPHCARDLEDDELITGLCTSDDCPRHDKPEGENTVTTPTCPKCGGHDFRMYVEQRIHVEFDEEGLENVYQGPEGDLDWDDETEAICNNDACMHTAPLGEMIAAKPKPKLYIVVKGGCVQYVSSDLQGVDVTVIDKDNDAQIEQLSQSEYDEHGFSVAEADSLPRIW